MPHGFEGWCVTGHVSASSGLLTSLSRAPPHKQRGARLGEAICLVCEQGFKSTPAAFSGEESSQIAEESCQRTPGTRFQLLCTLLC